MTTIPNANYIILSSAPDGSHQCIQTTGPDRGKVFLTKEAIFELTPSEPRDYVSFVKHWSSEEELEDLLTTLRFDRTVKKAKTKRVSRKKPILSPEKLTLKDSLLKFLGPKFLADLEKDKNGPQPTTPG